MRCKRARGCATLEQSLDSAMPADHRGCVSTLRSEKTNKSQSSPVSCHQDESKMDEGCEGKPERKLFQCRY
jgi:hypothetical protein